MWNSSHHFSPWTPNNDNNNTPQPPPLNPSTQQWNPRNFKNFQASRQHQQPVILPLPQQLRPQQQQQQQQPQQQWIMYPPRPRPQFTYDRRRLQEQAQATAASSSNTEASRSIKEEQCCICLDTREEGDPVRSYTDSASKTAHAAKHAKYMPSNSDDNNSVLVRCFASLREVKQEVTWPRQVDQPITLDSESDQEGEDAAENKTDSTENGNNTVTEQQSTPLEKTAVPLTETRPVANVSAETQSPSTATVSGLGSQKGSISGLMDCRVASTNSSGTSLAAAASHSTTTSAASSITSSTILSVNPTPSLPTPTTSKLSQSIGLIPSAAAQQPSASTSLRTSNDARHEAHPFISQNLSCTVANQHDHSSSFDNNMPSLLSDTINTLASTLVAEAVAPQVYPPLRPPVLAAKSGGGTLHQLNLPAALRPPEPTANMLVRPKEEIQQEEVWNENYCTSTTKSTQAGPMADSSLNEPMGIPHAYEAVIIRRKREGRLVGPCQFPGCGMEYKGESSEIRHIIQTHSKFHVYQCNLCTARVPTKLSHFRRFHKNRPRTTWQATDLRRTPEYRQKFADLYAQCYPILTDYDYLLGPAYPRPPEWDETLKSFITNHNSSQQTIWCKICPSGNEDKAIKMIGNTPGQLEHHILRYHCPDDSLPLFECYLCSWSGPSIFHHAYTAHRDIKFEDHRAEFVTELKEILNEMRPTHASESIDTAPQMSSGPPEANIIVTKSCSSATSDLADENSAAPSTSYSHAGASADLPNAHSQTARFPCSNTSSPSPTSVSSMTTSPMNPTTTSTPPSIIAPNPFSRRDAGQPAVKMEPSDYIDSNDVEPGGAGSQLSSETGGKRFPLRVLSYGYILAKRKSAGRIPVRDCTICQKTISFSFEKHVSTHFRKPMYSCRMCSAKFTDTSHHFQSKHKSLKFGNNKAQYYVDNRRQYDPQLIALMYQCYPQLHDSEFILGLDPPGHFIDRLRALTSANNQQLQQQQQQQSFCRICQQSIPSREAEFHVYKHSVEPLFECHLCSFVGADILNHYIGTHRDISFKIEDNRQRFLSYLLQLADQCFSSQNSSQSTTTAVSYNAIPSDSSLSSVSISTSQQSSENNVQSTNFYQPPLNPPPRHQAPVEKSVQPPPAVISPPLQVADARMAADLLPSTALDNNTGNEEIRQASLFLNQIMDRPERFNSGDLFKMTQGWNAMLVRASRAGAITSPTPCSYSPECGVPIGINFSWHISVHFPKPTAQCRQCPQRFKLNVANQHMRNVHGVKGNTKGRYYDDLREQFGSEQLTLLHQCFTDLYAFHSRLLGLQPPKELKEKVLDQVAYPLICRIPNCGFLVQSPGQLDTHIVRHTDSGLPIFECLQCTYVGPQIVDHTWLGPHRKAAQYELKLDDCRQRFVLELIAVAKRIISTGNGEGVCSEDTIASLSESILPEHQSTVISAHAINPSINGQSANNNNNNPMTSTFHYDSTVNSPLPAPMLSVGQANSLLSPIPSISHQQAPSATTSPLPAISDHQAPSATASPLPAISDHQAPSAATSPLPAISDHQASSAATSPLPAISDQQASSAITSPLPAISDNQAPAISEKPVSSNPTTKPSDNIASPAITKLKPGLFTGGDLGPLSMLGSTDMSSTSSTNKVPEDPIINPPEDNIAQNDDEIPTKTSIKMKAPPHPSKRSKPLKKSLTDANTSKTLSKVRTSSANSNSSSRECHNNPSSSIEEPRLSNEDQPTGKCGSETDHGEQPVKSRPLETDYRSSLPLNDSKSQSKTEAANSSDKISVSTTPTDRPNQLRMIEKKVNSGIGGYSPSRPPRLAFYLSLLEERFDLGYAFVQCSFPNCNKRIKSAHSFYYHHLVHMDKPTWQCGRCKARGSNTSSCMKHTKDQHPGQSVQEIDLRFQIEDHMVNVLFQCHPQLFQSEFYFPNDDLVGFNRKLSSLIQKKKQGSGSKNSEEQQRSLNCGRCGQTFPSPTHSWAIQLHVLDHLKTDFVAFECYTCDFRGNSDIVEHYAAVHKAAKRFFARKPFEDHRQQHEGEMIEMLSVCFASKQRQCRPKPNQTLSLSEAKDSQGDADCDAAGNPMPQPSSATIATGSPSVPKTDKLTKKRKPSSPINERKRKLIVNNPMSETPIKAIKPSTTKKKKVSVKQECLEEPPSSPQEPAGCADNKAPSSPNSPSSSNSSSNGGSSPCSPPTNSSLNPCPIDINIPSYPHDNLTPSPGWQYRSVWAKMIDKMKDGNGEGWHCAISGCTAKLAKSAIPDSHVWKESKLDLFECRRCGMKSKQTISLQHMLKHTAEEEGDDKLKQKKASKSSSFEKKLSIAEYQIDRREDYDSEFFRWAARCFPVFGTVDVWYPFSSSSGTSGVLSQKHSQSAALRHVRRLESIVKQNRQNPRGSSLSCKICFPETSDWIHSKRYRRPSSPPPVGDGVFEADTATGSGDTVSELDLYEHMIQNHFQPSLFACQKCPYRGNDFRRHYWGCHYGYQDGLKAASASASAKTASTSAAATQRRKLNATDDREKHDTALSKLVEECYA